MFLNFLEIGNALVAAAYKAAQRFQTGAFKFRLEKACPCSNKDHVPYCEGGTLPVESGWFRCLEALHLEYVETGLEVFAPQKFHLFLLCEVDRTIAQRAFDEVYDELIEILQKEKDAREPPNMAVACVNLLPEEYRRAHPRHVSGSCFVGAASSLDKKEE